MLIKVPKLGIDRGSNKHPPPAPPFSPYHQAPLQAAQLDLLQHHHEGHHVAPPGGQFENVTRRDKDKEKDQGFRRK